MGAAAAESEAESADPARVRRRRVLYVPGYDPRSPRAYFLLFKRELAKWSTFNGVKARLTRQGRDDTTPRWRFDAAFPEGPVETEFEFLTWHDLAERDFSMGAWVRTVRALQLLALFLWSGMFVRWWRWNWQFGLFGAYPWVMVGLSIVVGVAGAAGVLAIAAIPGLPLVLRVLVVLAGAAGLWAYLRLLRRLESKLYVLYLINDWIFTWRHIEQRDAVVAERFESFAQRLADLAAAPDCDEILVVGHSSGSFVAVEVVTRALELAPGLGRGGPAFALLTLGANTLVGGGGRWESSTRSAVRALLPEERVRWVEFYAPQDVMSFPRLDYRRAYKVDLKGRPQVNPTLRSAKFREAFLPQTYAKVRWDFFALHFQFLRTNEVRGQYDFYRMIAGPERLDRFPRTLSG